jgi:hypothetical protein
MDGGLEGFGAVGVIGSSISTSPKVILLIKENFDKPF